jgi:hypothetical protein
MSEPIDYVGPAYRPQLDCGDPIVERIRQKLARRSVTWQAKYGATVARDDMDTVAWLRHAQEEALDLAVYLELLIDELVAEADDGR